MAENKSRFTYRVDHGCTICLMCYYECPVKAITIVENVSAVINPELCTGCGKCSRNCPAEAIVRVPRGSETAKV